MKRKASLSDGDRPNKTQKQDHGNEKTPPLTAQDAERPFVDFVRTERHGGGETNAQQTGAVGTAAQDTRADIFQGVDNGLPAAHIPEGSGIVEHGSKGQKPTVTVPSHSPNLNNHRERDGPGLEKASKPEFEKLSDKRDPERGGTANGSTDGKSSSTRVFRDLVVACEHQRALVRHTRQCAELEEDARTRNDTSVSREQVEKARRINEFLRQRRIQLIRELAIFIKPGMATDPALSLLPSTWFANDIRDLQRYETAIRHVKENQRKLDAELKKLYSEEKILLICRTDPVLAGGNLTDRKSVHFGKKLEVLRESISKALDRQSKLHDDLQDALGKLSAVGQQLLATADEALTGAGLLPMLDRLNGVVTSDNGKPSLQPPFVCTNRAQRKDYGEAIHFPKRRASTKVGGSRAVPNMRNMIRERKRSQFEDAKRAWSEASRDFRLVREDYDANLANFLRDVERGEVSGSKTDFDADYFLARNESNHRLALAEDAFERAKKAAQRVGTLPSKYQTSDFTDQPGDGITSGEMDACVQTIDRAAIEQWRRAEAQREIELKQDKWEAGCMNLDDDGNRDDNGSSVAAESSRSQDRYDSSRRKKLIARWAAHQAEVRTALEPQIHHCK